MSPIRTSNRRAISAVLTTIIILVASIVLGTGVVVYSTSLFQTGGQQQNVQIIGVKSWVNGTYVSGAGGPGGGIGWGAAAVKNTGDKILSVSSITIRGAAVPYTNWYADTDPTRVTANFQAQYNYTRNDINGNLKGSANTGAGLGTIAGGSPGTCVQSPIGTNPPSMIVIQELPYAVTNTPICLSNLNGPVSLSPGASAIIYYKFPLNLVTTTDSGIVSTVSYLAGTAPISQTVRIANP